MVLPVALVEVGRPVAVEGVEPLGRVEACRGEEEEEALQVAFLGQGVAYPGQGVAYPGQGVAYPGQEVAYPGQEEVQVC